MSRVYGRRAITGRLGPDGVRQLAGEIRAMGARGRASLLRVKGRRVGPVPAGTDALPGPQGRECGFWLRCPDFAGRLLGGLGDLADGPDRGVRVWVPDGLMALSMRVDRLDRADRLAGKDPGVPDEGDVSSPEDPWDDEAALCLSCCQELYFLGPRAVRGASARRGRGGRGGGYALSPRPFGARGAGR